MSYMFESPELNSPRTPSGADCWDQWDATAYQTAFRGTGRRYWTRVTQSNSFVGTVDDDSVNPGTKHAWWAARTVWRFSVCFVNPISSSLIVVFAFGVLCLKLSTRGPRPKEAVASARSQVLYSAIPLMFPASDVPLYFWAPHEHTALSRLVASRHVGWFTLKRSSLATITVNSPHDCSDY